MSGNYYLYSVALHAATKHFLLYLSPERDLNPDPALPHTQRLAPKTLPIVQKPATLNESAPTLAQQARAQSKQRGRSRDAIATQNTRVQNLEPTNEQNSRARIMSLQTHEPASIRTLTNNTAYKSSRSPRKVPLLLKSTNTTPANPSIHTLFLDDSRYSFSLSLARSPDHPQPAATIRHLAGIRSPSTLLFQPIAINRPSLLFCCASLTLLSISSSSTTTTIQEKKRTGKSFITYPHLLTACCCPVRRDQTTVVHSTQSVLRYKVH